MQERIFDSPAFKAIMYAKFFMVVVIWGLLPLLVPVRLLPFFGLQAVAPHIVLLRVWGAIVLCDFFAYWYIYKRPLSRLAGYLMLFAVFDNGGLGAALLAVTVLWGMPWGVWANIPFQLFFGWCFLIFYRAHRASRLSTAVE
jgi:hypothetical protein